MKLGVSYIVFDGIELLESSIAQIRPHVEYINVIYQKRSWFDAELPTYSLSILTSLKNKGLIDELTCFEKFIPLKDKASSSIVKAKEYERSKRERGLANCLTNRCTHFLCMDVDEFYEPDKFIQAKNEIKQKGYTATAVRFINYVNLPTLHRGFDSMRVPFICKIDHGTRMGASFFVKCDHTRGIRNGLAGNHEFPHTQIIMHHMETVRKDLLLKYGSTTRAIFNRNRTNELVNSIKAVNEKTLNFSFGKIIFPGMASTRLVSSENIFNIPYTTWTKQ